MTATIEDVQWDLDSVTTSERLAHLEAQAKSTHGWVVVIGWIVVLQATLGLGFGAVIGYRAHQADTKAKARVACVQAGGAVADCLAAY